MEWENKVIVVDDILPKKQQEDLKRILFGNQFPGSFFLRSFCCFLVLTF